MPIVPNHGKLYKNILQNPSVVENIPIFSITQLNYLRKENQRTIFYPVGRMTINILK